MGFLLNISGIDIPFSALVLDMVLFIIVPLTNNVLAHMFMAHDGKARCFRGIFVRGFSSVAAVNLLLALILVFVKRDRIVLRGPLRVVLVTIPLVLRAFLVFFVTCKTYGLLGLPRSVSTPTNVVNTSGFFRLSITITITLFNAADPTTLTAAINMLARIPIVLALIGVTGGAGRSFEWLGTARFQ